ncbi:hypothetical protein Dsin_011102 [Dipteronia sinensis]|uniref:Uncharacterized protein n=1 Tax=Dipteronia sinensis TaxID=43782 RepID=A0AAE0EDQ2_9ROSI|nr:hypothetical protein Dsin_011102 [Dipteronia sinensis]
MAAKTSCASEIRVKPTHHFHCHSYPAINDIFFFHMKKDTEIKERKNCNNSQNMDRLNHPIRGSELVGERTRRARNQFHCLQTCQRLLGIPRQAQLLGFVTQVVGFDSSGGL